MSSSAITSVSAVMPCWPQKSSISCVSAIPPISEPASALRPTTRALVFSGGSWLPRKPTSTSVPPVARVGV